MANRRRFTFFVPLNTEGVGTMESIARTTSLSLTGRLVAGLAALLLSLLLIGGVGFAGDMRIHNGAHDTRHSVGFPCH